MYIYLEPSVREGKAGIQKYHMKIESRKGQLRRATHFEKLIKKCLTRLLLRQAVLKKEKVNTVKRPQGKFLAIVKRYLIGCNSFIK